MTREELAAEFEALANDIDNSVGSSNSDVMTVVEMLRKRAKSLRADEVREGELMRARRKMKVRASVKKALADDETCSHCCEAPHPPVVCKECGDNRCCGYSCCPGCGVSLP